MLQSSLLLLSFPLSLPLPTLPTPPTVLFLLLMETMYKCGQSFSTVVKLGSVPYVFIHAATRFSRDNISTLHINILIIVILTHAGKSFQCKPGSIRKTNSPGTAKDGKLFKSQEKWSDEWPNTFLLFCYTFLFLSSINFHALLLPLFCKLVQLETQQALNFPRRRLCIYSIQYSNSTPHMAKDLAPQVDIVPPQPAQHGPK